MFGPKYASLASRLLGHLVDQVIFIALIFIQGLVVAKVAPDFADWLYDFSKNKVESVLIVWLYFALMESSRLQASVGKIVFHLKITDLNENKISFGRASLRFILAIFSALSVIGLLMGGFTKRKQMLHDIATKCVVTKR